MKVTIDASGRIVVPAYVRSKMGLTPGTELALEVEEGGLRLIREAPAPKLVRRGRRLVVVPSVDPKSVPKLDIPAMIEEERNRWPF